MRLKDLALIALLTIPLAMSGGCSDTESGGGTGGSGGSGGSGGDGGTGGAGGTGGSGGSGGSGGTGGSGGDATPESYAANVCVGAKQVASSTFCKSMFDAWSAWESDQDGGARDAAVEAARSALGDSWDAAESDAADAGADCADLALTSTDAASGIETWITSVVSSVNNGLDLGQTDQAACGAEVLAAAGDACEAVLSADGAHVGDLYADPDGSTLEAAKSAALDAFSTAWADATSESCPTSASEEDVRDDVQALTDELVRNTIIAPSLDDQQYTTLIPTETDYLGRTYTPQCMQGSEYRYFAKRGSVNKLLMYYQGGGACWDNLTCGGTPLTGAICKTSAASDDPNSFSAGFADLSNENNPFRDWNIVFVTYCTCDIHFGDATQDYGGVTVEHKGYHNSKVAEKWAREHFLNPETVFVTGSSAGAYGAWFNAPLLHEVWPASQMHVLADAGNGVITTDFLQNEFANWNFVANLPDIPGVLEAITTGDGMPAYTEAVATEFPDTNWAHYATMFDGGSGGQTGFYNVMLLGSPLGALSWWDASCAFGDAALAQSMSTFSAVPSNYRYYFGTGSRHTMWGNNKVYGDTTGGVPTIVDWVGAMLASGPNGRDENWTNVLCDNCGLLLDGDPRPNPLQAPFEQQGEDVVIVCE
ncbi:MAG: pectin acetylesterase-family hydrolase [Polyangiales bacterium]